MGYTTEFQGALKFTKELSASQISYLSKILGVDFRDIKELMNLTPKKDGEISDLTYAIDLKFTADFAGLKWDGTEKSYEMDKQVEFVIAYMTKKYPDFGLQGFMNAQGEEVDDRWRLNVENNKVTVIKTPPKGKKIQCPHCGEYFYLEI